jgi:hypothetical protein
MISGLRGHSTRLPKETALESIVLPGPVRRRIGSGATRQDLLPTGCRGVTSSGNTSRAIKIIICFHTVFARLLSLIVYAFIEVFVSCYLHGVDAGSTLCNRHNDGERSILVPLSS